MSPSLRLNTLPKCKEDGTKFKYKDKIILQNGEERFFRGYSRGYPKFFTKEGFENYLKTAKTMPSRLLQSGNTRTLEGVAVLLLNGAKTRAKKNNSNCDLNLQLIIQNLKQNCAQTGLTFEMKANGSKNRSPYAPSIDRIDSKNKNYTMDNCQLVLISVNQAKSDWKDEIIMPILKKWVCNYETKNNIIIN